MLPNSKWVIAPPRQTLVVGVADMVVSNDGGAEIVTYSLGSCLGVAIYAPVKNIGGLLHLMLPDSKIDAAKAVSAPFMFVDTGVPRLFHAAYNLGADRNRLVVKVAGGGSCWISREFSTSASATSTPWENCWRKTDSKPTPPTWAACPPAPCGWI